MWFNVTLVEKQIWRTIIVVSQAVTKQKKDDICWEDGKGAVYTLGSAKYATCGCWCPLICFLISYCGTFVGGSPTWYHKYQIYPKYLSGRIQLEKNLDKWLFATMSLRGQIRRRIRLHIVQLAVSMLLIEEVNLPVVSVLKYLRKWFCNGSQ